MNDPKPLRELALETVATAYAGRTRYTQLEYEALLANLSIGIAFTRDRRFFLCNPRFAEMFGYGPDELIGMPGETMYPNRESYLALGQIATPILSAGRQLDIEWEVRRRDGSPFLCRLIAKAIDPANTQQGTVWIVEDITDRRRHADEVARLLREQEAILGTASVGIVFLKDRRIVRCNRRYEEMYGYGPGELDGKPTAVLYANPEDLAHAAGAYEQLRRGQTARRVEQRRRKDGSVFWTRADGRAVDPQDPLKGSVWTVEDVTEQRRAEDELQRVLAEQQALLDNVVVGIAFSRERKVVRCNRRFEEMFGFAAGEAIGVSWRQMYFTEDEFEMRAQVYTELDQGRTHTREQWLRRQDGSGFWCRVAGRAVAAGDPARGHVWLIEDVSERRRADESLERLVREQDAVLQNAVTGIIFVKDRRIVRCNRRFEEIFGYGVGELLNQPTRFMFASSEEYEAGGETLYEPVWRGETVFLERRHVRKDGTPIWCSLSGRAVHAGDPAQGSVWLFDDITQEHESEERVQRALAEQELILDNASVGIAFVRNRAIQRCNRFLEDMVGAGPGDLIGQSTGTLFASREEWEEAGRVAYGTTAPGGTHDAEWRFKRRDGTTFACRTRGRRIDLGEPEQEWIWSIEDVTAEREADRRVQQALGELERKVAERTAELEEAKARAQHLADHDALTGLPNRRLLEDRLTQALALSSRNRKSSAVMFVDIDRFKTINDSLGHAVGDALLKEVAERLVKQLREGDTICRIGGDEFVIVLPEVKRSSDVAHVAQKVIEQLSLPVTVEERELVVTCSIGIAVYPDDGRTAESLIRNADAAMYHAKELGRASYQFFTEQMNQAASRRLQLENDLRRAVGKGELRVHYQPIIEAASGRIAAHEALVRWQHPKRGLVLPAEFIQLAEETGIILKIGEWVLAEACRWSTFIGARSHDGGDLQIAVNLSARQFNDPHLPRVVARALKETGLPPRLLELEITESTAMQQTDATLRTLKKLKQLGVSIAIDDFGTGYSSLSYLRRFPVDKVKIDRSFVAEVPGNRDQGAIVSAIIALAHALQIRVVAEGVETEAQREFLKSCGCDFIQGFLVGRPADADSAAKEYV
ncbi:MAG TPA: EAL domain-containing protein [Burkholderiales bacterium]|nr:EAL domain-containing protein [Burkholderiales bacterium]